MPKVNLNFEYWIELNTNDLGHFICPFYIRGHSRHLSLRPMGKLKVVIVVFGAHSLFVCHGLADRGEM